MSYAEKQRKSQLIFLCLIYQLLQLHKALPGRLKTPPTIIAAFTHHPYHSKAFFSPIPSERALKETSKKVVRVKGLDLKRPSYIQEEILTSFPNCFFIF